jgi:cellulose synthase/poly-beta-1,6-N-acetylglucosamine synthase-like glycosyltransferase
MAGTATTKQNHEPSVSVVVAVKNERAMIEPCLKSLLDQDYGNYEIIVVDAGSTDSTPEVVEKIVSDNKGVRLLRAEGYAAAGRNVGIMAAMGDMLAFIDGDCIAPRDWLRQLIGPLASEPSTTAGVGGPSIPIDQIENVWSTITNSVLQTFLGSAGSVQVRVSKKGYVRSLSTANSAFRTNVVRELGGFDQRLSLCEDADLSTRMLKAGFRLRFVPSGIVYHAREYHSLSNFGHHMFRYGSGRGKAIAMKPKTNLSLTALGIASFIVIEILLFASAMLGSQLSRLLFMIFTSTYLLVIVATSLVLVRGIKTRFFAAIITFLVLHTSYASGLLTGFFSQATRMLRVKRPT